MDQAILKSLTDHDVFEKVSQIFNSDKFDLGARSEACWVLSNCITLGAMEQKIHILNTSNYILITCSGIFKEVKLLLEIVQSIDIFLKIGA